MGIRKNSKENRFSSSCFLVGAISLLGLTAILGLGFLALLILGPSFGVNIAQSRSSDGPIITDVPTVQGSEIVTSIPQGEEEMFQLPATPTLTPPEADANPTPVEEVLATEVAVPPTAVSEEQVVTTPTAIPPTSAPPTATVVPATATPVKSAQSLRPPNPLHMDSPEYGAHAFLWWRPENADRDLGMMKAAGLTWAKQNFSWHDLEGAGKGIFEWKRPDVVVDLANKHGVNLLARVDYCPPWARADGKTTGPPDNLNDFGDFVYALASHYKGRIRAYQIWNEPNLSREWGDQPPDAVRYVQMLRIAYQRIKEADPGAIVISAGLSPTTYPDPAVAVPDEQFLRQMYDAGLATACDAVGLHGAGFKAAPEADPAEVAKDPVLTNGDPSPEEMKRIYCFRHVEDMRRIMVEYGDVDKQVVILEFGWTTDHRPDSPYAWHAVEDEHMKGDYIVRAFKWAKENWSPWIGTMIVWNFGGNPDWDKNNEEYWWSICKPSGDPRAAYFMIKEMLK